MPRYITVDDALNAMCDNCDSVQAICPHYPCKRYKAVERIHFADVVEVVRCKDCKWYEGGICYLDVHEDDPRRIPEAYCSVAERREDETN